MLLLWLQHGHTAGLIGIEAFVVLVIFAVVVWWRSRKR